LSNFRHGAMKARVEACDLRHVGQPLRHRLNRREVMRLVERCERHELAKLRKHVGRDDRGTNMTRPTVHDPVTYADDTRAREGGMQPTHHVPKRGTRIANVGTRPRSRHDDVCAVASGHARR
jgi:hypothetical protein